MNVDFTINQTQTPNECQCCCAFAECVNRNMFASASTISPEDKGSVLSSLSHHSEQSELQEAEMTKSINSDEACSGTELACLSKDSTAQQAASSHGQTLIQEQML